LGAAGEPTDVQEAFVEPGGLTYPYAYERISQLFDSPNAPDLVVNPKSYAYGRQPGQHGALDVIQSRSPLVFMGPGVKRGALVEADRSRWTSRDDRRLMGFPLIDGMEPDRTDEQRAGRGGGVYLERQDGARAEGHSGPVNGPPERVYSCAGRAVASERRHRLEEDPDSIPIAAAHRNGAMLRHGASRTSDYYMANHTPSAPGPGADTTTS